MVSDQTALSSRLAARGRNAALPSKSPLLTMRQCRPPSVDLADAAVRARVDDARPRRIDREHPDTRPRFAGQVLPAVAAVGALEEVAPAAGVHDLRVGRVDRDREDVTARRAVKRLPPQPRSVAQPTPPTGLQLPAGPTRLRRCRRCRRPPRRRSRARRARARRRCDGGAWRVGVLPRSAPPDRRRAARGRVRARCRACGVVGRRSRRLRVWNKAIVTSTMRNVKAGRQESRDWLYQRAGGLAAFSSMPPQNAPSWTEVVRGVHLGVPFRPGVASDGPLIGTRRCSTLLSKGARSGARRSSGG